MPQVILLPLYEQYMQERSWTPNNLPLSVEQFELLVVFFPCLIVAASDGIIDKEEWVYIKYLARFTTSSLSPEPEGEVKKALEKSYFKEFSYLAANLAHWRPSFFKALHEILEKDPDAKEYILDALYLFADASDGTSAEEKASINQIIEELKLEDK